MHIFMYISYIHTYFRANNLIKSFSIDSPDWKNLEY